MKIHFLTDLHLEFGDMTLPGGDTLLLGGDIVVADMLHPRRTDAKACKHKRVVQRFVEDECTKYNRVYMIMGNHEHYHGLFDATYDILTNVFAGTNIEVFDKEIIDLNGEWRLFGATLWTNYNNRDWFTVHAAKDKMNDHAIVRKLKMGPEPVIGEKVPYEGTFHPHDAADDHDKTLRILSDFAYADRDKKLIVMTHHAPCGRSIHHKYAGDLLNYAYFTELEGFIADHPNIKYWFHGHTHHNFDYEVHQCRIICNPRGYDGYDPNEDFNINLEIEL